MRDLIVLLKEIMEISVTLFLGIAWLIGFVIAKGFWSTVFCLNPIYSWYLVVEYYWSKYYA